MKKTLVTLLALLITMFMLTLQVYAGETTEVQPDMYATFWSLIPPVVAIVLALITKEVYSSLFVGITIGGLFYSSFDLEVTMNHVLHGGVLASLSDSYNVGILIFLVILGTMVCLMNKAKGSVAFGNWAGNQFKSRIGVQLATMGLGVLIFVDDYFNCLTVGSVMRPVTDRYKVSRAKLAYLIDSTAAPICIIAPISSWAAAVTGFVEGEDGFSIFLRAIPYNFYALLTIVMVVGIIVLNFDYGTMKQHEINALNGDIFTSGVRQGDGAQQEETGGKVIDLILPIVVLIVGCVMGMLYTGGLFSGADLITAFSSADASVGLVLGSFFGLVITIIFYATRRVLNLEECMSCLPEGFKAMVPANLILTLAWTLKNMTDSLGAKAFVEAAMYSGADSLMNFLPAIIFLVAILLAFATGTSWGTFGILIPIVVGVFSGVNDELMIIAISACLAGAVCGDHCSPISDTTIMASAGAQCDHVNHVSTQLPYAITVAAVSFVTYLIAGFVQSPWITLPIGIALLCVVLIVIRNISRAKA